MAGKLELINTALARLSENYILSLDESTTQQLVASAHYDTTLDALFREHPWNFATSNIELPRLLEYTAFQFAYAYQLPSDFIRLIEVYDTPNYKVQGRTVLSDEKKCRIRYVRRVADPSAWDASFTEAFTFRLAAALSYAISHSASLSEQLNILAQQKTRWAKALDSTEDVTDAMDGVNSSIYAARF